MNEDKLITHPPLSYLKERVYDILKNMKRLFSAILLCLALVLPVSALAQEQENSFEAVSPAEIPVEQFFRGKVVEILDEQETPTGGNVNVY